MTVEQACEFFANVPSIARKLDTLNEVGLGYINWPTSYKLLAAVRLSVLNWLVSYRAAAPVKPLYFR